MKPHEAAKLVDFPNANRLHEMHAFVLASSARDLQLFVHNITTNTTDAKEWRNLASLALNVRLAEDAEKSAEKLAAQTEKLALQIVELREISKEHKQVSENAGKSVDDLNRQTGKLIEVANAQKQLAEESGRQTKMLIYLTWGLVGVSVALLVFALWQTIILKEDAKANNQQVQAGKNH